MEFNSDIYLFPFIDFDNFVLKSGQQKDTAIYLYSIYVIYTFWRSLLPRCYQMKV